MRVLKRPAPLPLQSAACESIFRKIAGLESGLFNPFLLRWAIFLEGNTMSEINLGMQWNVAEDLDAALKTEQERLAKNPQQSEGRKLTPAQQRDATFKEIAQAIDESDFERVQELLASNPKLTFTVGDFGGVYQSLIKNFDIPTAKSFTARGLHLSLYYLYQHLAKSHNATLLEYFIERCEAEKSTNSLDNLYSHCLKGFTSNVSDQRRKELREQRKMLEQQNPNALTKALESESFFPIFTTYNSLLPEVERTQLQELSTENWNTVFTSWFKYFHVKHYRRNPQVGLKMFKNILGFLTDFPQANAGWNAALEFLRVQNQTHKDFVSRYFKTNEDFAQSELGTVLKKFQDGYRSTPFPFKHAKAQAYMGFTSFEMQELGAFDWECNGLTTVNGEKPPFEMMEMYTVPSFVHLMVKSASPASLALLESTQGKQLYVECLKEPAVLKSWCTNAHQDMINTVVRACPQLLEWNDAHNNSLAHYLVFLRSESSKTFGQLIARLNHNWLLQDNDKGISVKNLFKSFGASEDMLNSLDKEAIKRSVKDAGIKKTRRTAPAPKRRM